ncbi:MAG: dTMP kinase [Candidatus Omnitrophica bacterium]|nr:dTMP kinase [Candidatus Omnitrophota bacterium]
MAKKTIRGILITFEGSEGCGKSTQSRLLYRYLKDKGYPVIYLREPGDTRVGEKIRKILLDPRNEITSLGETLLYMTARAELVYKVIQPALRQGRIVICDRFLDSTFAYQGYGLGVELKVIRFLGKLVTLGIKPDLTIFLDLPVKKCLEKRKPIKDRIERRSYRYHIRVRKGYLRLVLQDPERIKLVKVDKDKKRTQQKIREIVNSFLLKWHGSFPDKRTR